MRIPTSLIICIMASISVFQSSSVYADVLVVVNKNNDSELSSEYISRIFLGKKKSFSNGVSAIPLDLTPGDPARTNFVKSLLKKNDQQIKAYWAQLLFTGKGTPPREVDNASMVIDLISKNPSLIGYIDSTEMDDRVKVVYIIQ